MIRCAFLLAVASTGLLSIASVLGEEKFGPGDPMAAIDGDPIYLGELNLILSERLGARDLDRVGMDVKQATAALLVRRHLAMKSLQQQGGGTLEGMMKRQVESFATEAKRRGSSLEQQAKARLADEQSLIADIRWRTAWAQYLKSKLNEANLRVFFERQQSRYGGGKWRVSQIFVDLASDDAASVSAATARMKTLADKIVASGSVESAFADAARDYSDSGSASDGGMVGWVEKDGDLPKAVMDVVRRTNVGKIGGPIRSPMGMHLVLVHEMEKGDLKYEDLTDQSQIRRDAANALFDALVKMQAQAKIVWFIGALKPQSFRIIPE